MYKSKLCCAFSSDCSTSALFWQIRVTAQIPQRRRRDGLNNAKRRDVLQINACPFPKATATSALSQLLKFKPGERGFILWLARRAEEETRLAEERSEAHPFTPALPHALFGSRKAQGLQML